MFPAFTGRHTHSYGVVLCSLLGLATACTEDVSTLPVDMAAPSSTLSLAQIGEAAAGRTWGWEVEGLTPGADVRLVVARGGAGTGACPADLGGNCYDMLPGNFGYRTVRSGVADASGAWTGSLVFPAGVRRGAYQIQAVSPDGADSNESNLIEMQVRDDCRTDSAEPNNDAGSAADIGAGRSGDVICSNDFDWYRTSVAPGSYVELTISHELTDGDLDVVLFDAAGNEIDLSARAGGEEYLTWYNQGSAPVDVFLWVYAFADFDDNGVAYSITREEVVAGVCPEDALEDDDVAGDATVIGEGVWGPAQSCADDSDWYAIEVTAGDVLDVVVLEELSLGDVDFLLYDGNFDVQNFVPEDSLAWRADADETVYVEVSLSSDSAFEDGNSYELEVTMSPGSTCVDDALEEDDSVSEARLIGAGRHAASSCWGDHDWYQIDLLAGETVDIFVDEVWQEGNVDFQAFLADGTELTSGTDDSMVYTAQFDETIWLRAELTTDPNAEDGNTYELVVDIDVQDACVFDFAEPNNSQTEAYPVAIGTYTDLGGCDTDWFELPVQPNNTVEVELAFDNDDADIDLEVTDDQGNRLGLSQSTSDREFLSIDTGSLTSLFIRVYVYGDTGGPTAGGAPYDLTIRTL